MYWAEADFEKEGQRAGQKNRTQTGENHCMGGGGGGGKNSTACLALLKSAPASLERSLSMVLHFPLW